LLDNIFYLFLASIISIPFILARLVFNAGLPFDIPAYVFLILGQFLYYTLFEAATKGKTIGKLITGTRAINIDGTPISFSRACLRSLYRFPLLDIVALVGRPPAHDTLSRTVVIKSASLRSYASGK
jgi:uncharacterized RDD family membrane protein YckC